MPSGRALDQPLKSSEYKLEKDGLRTHPAAKETAIDHRKQNDKDNKGNHPHRKNEKVLRPEYFSKEDKLAVNDVDQEKWIVIDFNKWQYKKNNQVEIRYNIKAKKSFNRRCYKREKSCSNSNQND